MAHDYEKSKSIALKTIILLGIITIVEVAIALVGKGYIIKGFYVPLAIMGLAMIALSLYKAYKIVYEFMHMGHEVKGLRLSVLLPMLLLVWAVIAFFQEGSSWLGNRDRILESNKKEVEESIQVQEIPDETFKGLE